MQPHDTPLKTLMIKETEADLLKHIGEELKSFFNPETIQYSEWRGPPPFVEEKPQPSLWQRFEQRNPRADIAPMAQINIVANVTFHLMAQQLALLFLSKPGISRTEVYDTAFSNVRALTLQYIKQIREETHETDGEGSNDRQNPSNL